MRLGFHYHEPVYLTSQGALKTSGPQGRFLDSLAEQCNEVVCFLHSPRTGELPYLDYSLRSPNVSWVNVGPHRSLPARMLRSPLTANRVKQWQDRLDVVLLRGPSPLLPAFARALKPLPIALLLVGDYVKVIQDSPQPAWRKALIRVWAQANARGQLRAARRALTLVNSRELYGSLHPLVPNVHLTQTTTLTASDFLQRDDTCSERPIRLLYAGRMDRGKGLLVLVEALRLLLHRGEDVVLDLAGPPQPRDNVLAEASDLAERLGIGNRIVYHGFRPLGDELFGFYKRADLFVLPSLRTEGFPRSLWEAMAYSLPVVATAGRLHTRLSARRSPRSDCGSTKPRSSGGWCERRDP